MGCGASKAAQGVVDTAPAAPAAAKDSKAQVAQEDVKQKSAKSVDNAKDEEKPQNKAVVEKKDDAATGASAGSVADADASSKPPSAGSRKTPVAFEISADELKTNPLTEETSGSRGSSLPGLGMSQEEIRRKLAGAEDHWREQEKRSSARSRASLRSAASRASGASNPEAIKQRMEEREARVEENKKKDAEKRAAEQAAREERARAVLERKANIAASASQPGLGIDDVEDSAAKLNLSWGGELETAAEGNGPAV